MASLVEKEDSKLNSWAPKWERKEHKKLRYSGQEYVSKSGKVIPAKKQPELVCTCPQKCGEKIPASARERLFTEFYRLSDHATQNRFLQAHIEIRAVQRRFWRQQQRTASGRIQRRVSCKYQVPLIINSDDVSEQGEVRPGVKIVEVCQKAFMNVYAITEKRVRIQRERLICSAQELAGSPSPVARVDPSLLGLQRRGGGGNDNAFPYTLPRDLFAATAPLTTLSNLSITQSRVASEALFSKMSNRHDLLAALGDRDVTMIPAHNSSLSIIPVKGVDAHQSSVPAAFPLSAAKIPRDVTMIPVNGTADQEEQCMPTDLSMPKAVTKTKSPEKTPAAAAEPISLADSNQPVDLTVKSSKPKNESSENLSKRDDKEQQRILSKLAYETVLQLKAKSHPKEAHSIADLDIKISKGFDAKMDEDNRPPMPPVPFNANGYDLALVNSFFQNQLWQPEYIDIDNLRGYQRKLEETSERPKERKRRPRKAIRISPTEIVQCDKVSSMEISEQVPNNLANKSGTREELEMSVDHLDPPTESANTNPNLVPNNCDEPKDLSDNQSSKSE